MWLLYFMAYLGLTAAAVLRTVDTAGSAVLQSSLVETESDSSQAPELFKLEQQSSTAENVINSDTKLGFNTDTTTECSSTGYYPKVGWISLKLRSELIKQPRPYLTQLRTSIYKNADPEQCHKSSMTDVTSFLECQVRRHMRLELGVPGYPALPV